MTPESIVRMIQIKNLTQDSVEGEEDNKLERVPSALSKLTGPSYGLSDIIRSGAAVAAAAGGGEGEGQQQPPVKKAGPIKEAYLNKILDFLFPDAKGDSEFPFPKEFAPRPRSRAFPYEVHFHISLNKTQIRESNLTTDSYTVIIDYCDNFGNDVLNTWPKMTFG